MPCFAELYEDLGPQADRHRVLVLGFLGLPCRAGFLVHLGDRLDRRGPADQRVARRDGRRLGAVRGLHQDPDRRRSTPRWCTASASPARACCAACWRCRPTRTPWRRWCPTRCRPPACRPGSDWTPGSGPPSRWPRSHWIPWPPHAAPIPIEPASRSTNCWPGRTSPIRCAATTSRRSPTARRRSCWPPGDRARELRENPAWITGFEHRIETPVLGARDLTTSPSTAASAKAATGRRRRLDRRGRALRAVHPSAADPHRGHRAGRLDEGQPVRRRTGRQPDVLDRPGAHRLRGPAHLRRLGAAGAGARHERGCAATESGRRHGGEVMHGGSTTPRCSAPGRPSTSPSARTSR